MWSHDGSGMFFGSPRLGSTTIFQKGGVSPEVVFADSVLVASLATYPNDVSQDGQFLLYQSTSRGYDLGVIPLSGDRKPIAFVSGPSNEVQGRFSPNHRWIAYASDESGKFEVVRAAISTTKHATDDDLGSPAACSRSGGATAKSSFTSRRTAS